MMPPGQKTFATQKYYEGVGKKWSEAKWGVDCW